MYHKQAAEPPKDDEVVVIPLPCWGRGSKLVPLDELPLFQFLKRQAAEKSGLFIPSQPGNATGTAEKTRGATSPDAQLPSETVPKIAPESSKASDERDKMLHEQEPLTVPAAVAAAPPQKHGIPSSMKMHVAPMIKQPTRARPCTTSRQTRARPGQLPLYPCPPAPVPDAEYSGPRLDTAEAQLKAAQVPVKKSAFDPSEYTHPHDLTWWAASLAQVQPREPVSDSDDDDGYALQRPLTFEQDSICETLSTTTLESSSMELEHEPTPEGRTAEALPGLEPTETSTETLTGSLPETPADSLTETPLEGTSQFLEPLPPQEVDFTIDSVAADQKAFEKSDMVNRLSCCAPQRRTPHLNDVLKCLCGKIQYHSAVT
ncbi:uncharacterized protein [Dermacentor andersoni]|uniref:uncharacterized protein isoform X1 n=1 Tax=Dermacentor andersoni TaxID=34620 RepID=UPI0021550BB8